MVYTSWNDKRNMRNGSIVWGFAFRKTDSRRAFREMHLMQKPVQGRLAADRRNTPQALDENRTPAYFVPLRKDSNTECAWSKAVDNDSRCYADTEEEAVAAYNRIIDTMITGLKEEITELEGMKI